MNAILLGLFFVVNLQVTNGLSPGLSYELSLETVHAGSDHDARVNSLLAANPGAVRDACDRCIWAETNLTEKQTIHEEALRNLSSAQEWLVEKERLYEECIANRTAMNDESARLKALVVRELTTGTATHGELVQFLSSLVIEVDGDDVAGAREVAVTLGVNGSCMESTRLYRRIRDWRNYKRNGLCTIPATCCDHLWQLVLSARANVTFRNETVNTTYWNVVEANVTKERECQALFGAPFPPPSPSPPPAPPSLPSPPSPPSTCVGSSVNTANNPATNIRTASAEADNFGRAISEIGDVDGDGVKDLAVGSPTDADIRSETRGRSRTNVGAVWILLMNANSTVKASQKISATAGNGPELAGNDKFGTAVAGLGDVNGDGSPDIVVGAPGSNTDSSGRDVGAIFIIFLNADGTAGSHQKISEDGTGNELAWISGHDDEPSQDGLGREDKFGSAVANLGDLDGDGQTDIAVGAPYDDDGLDDAGAVWIIFLDQDGLPKAGSTRGGRRYQKISRPNLGAGVSLVAQAQFGMGLSAPGDLNGDGVGDLAVGAPGDDDGGSDTGAIFIIFLGRNGLPQSSAKISSSSNSGPTLGQQLAPGDQFGTQGLAALGDLNNDGVPDLAAITRRDLNDLNGPIYILYLTTDGSVDYSERLSDATNGYGACTGEVLFDLSGLWTGEGGVLKLAAGYSGSTASSEGFCVFELHTTHC